MRVYELAKQMGIPTTELMNRLKELGIEVKNHFAVLDPAVIKQLKDDQIASSSPRADVKEEEQNEPQEEQGELQEEQSEPSEEQSHGSRTDRLRLEKSEQRRKIILIASSVGVVVILLVAGILLRGSFSAAPEPEKAKENQSNIAKETGQRNAKDQKQPYVIKPLINVLVIGVEEADGRKIARGLLLAKLDFNNHTIQAINIPGRTYIHIPGLEFDQISESFTMGVNSTQKAVEGLLQVPIGNRVVVRYSDFEYLVNEKRFEIAFDKTIETGFFASEKDIYRKKVARINAGKVDIVSLPVKYVSINGEPYYEPNNEEVNRLLEALWGIKREVNTKTVRVILLNGSGQPGVGRSVSQKISAKGFTVSDIKNADRFDYKTTQIIAYREEFREKAKEIKQILGVGEVLVQVTAPDIAEIAIVIGSDYKITN